MGLDAYYKMARDMIDDGQFGQAVVLTQFNWARGYSEGGEFKLKYTNGTFNAYANFAYNISRAIGPESNQYLFDADEYAYLLTHYHYTDDMQRMTGSAGASYRWHDTLFTADLIYGSGLRARVRPRRVLRAPCAATAQQQASTPSMLFEFLTNSCGQSIAGPRKTIRPLDQMQFGG
jgi:hypothetical protein